MNKLKNIVITEETRKEDVAAQLHTIRNELMANLQTADNTQREEIQEEIEVIDSIFKAIDNMTEDFKDFSLLIKTYCYFAEKKALDSDKKLDLEEFAGGDNDLITVITGNLAFLNDKELHKEWILMSKNRGLFNVYEVIGMTCENNGLLNWAAYFYGKAYEFYTEEKDSLKESNKLIEGAQWKFRKIRTKYLDIIEEDEGEIANDGNESFSDYLTQDDIDPENKKEKNNKIIRDNALFNTYGLLLRDGKKEEDMVKEYEKILDSTILKTSDYSRRQLPFAKNKGDAMVIGKKVICEDKQGALLYPLTLHVRQFGPRRIPVNYLDPIPGIMRAKKVNIKDNVTIYQVNSIWFTYKQEKYVLYDSPSMRYVENFLKGLKVFLGVEYGKYEWKMCDGSVNYLNDTDTVFSIMVYGNEFIINNKPMYNNKENPIIVKFYVSFENDKAYLKGLIRIINGDVLAIFGEDKYLDILMGGNY